MDTKTSIFLFLAIFYTVLFGLLGLIPSSLSTIDEDSLVEQDFVMPDTFLLSNCDLYVFDAWSQYYECGDYEFSAELVTSQNDTHITIDNTGEQQGFFRWVLERSSWGTNLLGFFDNINNRIANLDPIFQIILWGPLAILLVWLMILLVVWIIPFIGGS